MTTQKDVMFKHLKVALREWLSADAGWPASRASDAVCRAAMRYCDANEGIGQEVIDNL